MRRFIVRLVSAVRLIAKDPRIPKPLRWLLALSLLPIPGPFDEAVLLLIAPVLAIFYGERMKEAWRAAIGPTPPSADDH